MQSSEHNNGQDGVKNIKAAFFLNLLFTLIEFVGGILTNSVAILSDAVHDLGDSFSLGLSWYFQKVAKRPRTKEYTYGYKRFSLLGAVINSVVLLVGSVVILVHAIPRLFNPQQPNVEGMLLLAVLGVIINGLAVLRLRKGSSINERVCRCICWKMYWGGWPCWRVPVLCICGCSLYRPITFYWHLPVYSLQCLPQHAA